MRTGKEIAEQGIMNASALATFTFDLEALQYSFDEIAELAGRVSGTEAALVNLIDEDFQWTVGSFGICSDEITTHDSICQYAVLRETPLEINNIQLDKRFAHLKIVQSLDFSYYFGIPLITSTGSKLGTLCVLDRHHNCLDTEKKQLLILLSKEVVKRLEDIRTKNALQQQLKSIANHQRKLAHDIRSPLSGIKGLANLAASDIQNNKTEDLPLYLQYIEESGDSLLELASDVLSVPYDQLEEEQDQINLADLRSQLLKLFMPKVISKRMSFAIYVSQPTSAITFGKKGVLQLISNLISNALKFTPENGRILVDLHLKIKERLYLLDIIVTDDGIGMDRETVNAVLEGTGQHKMGTAGEVGYGMGLSMVRTYVENAGGRIGITSAPGAGTTVKITVPAGSGEQIRTKLSKHR